MGRNLAFVAVLALFFMFLAGDALARTWTSRNGAGTLEAELIDADATHAVLKRTSDGKLFKTPLAKLSLGDVQYVREAMKAAGMDAPAPEAPAAEPAEKPPESERKEGSGAGGPPLTKAAESGWQASPDPAPQKLSLKKKDLKILVPSTYGRDDAVFSPGGLFALLGGDRGAKVRELWDIGAGRRVGKLTDVLSGAQKAALSPDGKHVATTGFQSRGKIEIWSTAEGQVVKSIDLPSRSGSVYGLGFAGPDRIVASLPLEKALVVWDLASGEKAAAVEIYPTPMQERYAISAGGAYAALVKDNRLRLYDLRNGALAGDIALRTENSGTGSAVTHTLGFSADGGEVAAVVEFAGTKRLHCWSMADGSLLKEHELNDRLPTPRPSTKVRHATIQWLPNDRGWLLYGAALVDREAGGPVWVADAGASSSYPAYRRLVDENSLVQVAGEQDSRMLTVRPIPWEEIAESQRIVASGGTVDDLGLPDVSQADYSQVRRVSLSPNSWSYEPPEHAGAGEPEVGNLHVSTRDLDVKGFFIGSPDSGRAVICSSPADRDQRRLGMGGYTAGELVDSHDLASGDRLHRFEVPFATELLDVSPSAQRGVFCRYQKRDRLDIYDIGAGEHVIGFRPYADQDDAYRVQVQWAALIGEDQLLTLNHGNELVLWSLPQCRAEYRMQLAPGAGVTLNAAHTHFVAGNNAALYLVEAATGETCGVLTLPVGQSLQVSDAKFRADDRQLAVAFSDGEKRRLAVWDLHNQELLCDLSTPYEYFGLAWTSLHHVLLTKVANAGELDGGGSYAMLVDVDADRVVWRYIVEFGHTPRATASNRYLALLKATYPLRRLAAISLPQPNEQEIIDQTAAPEPLFVRGKAVALDIELGGLPSELENRREREDKLKKQFETHFQEKLEQHGLRLDPDAGLKFTVSLKALTKEDWLILRTRLGLSRVRALLLATNTVQAQIRIQADDEDETVLFETEKLVQQSDISSDDKPADMPLITYVQLRQWQAAARWCLGQSLPAALYHPSAYQGVGESTVSGDGVRYVRRLPEP